MANAARAQQPTAKGAAEKAKSPLFTWLASPVSGASLGLFRIFFGVLMLLEAISIARPMASAAGSIPLETYYTAPEITFHFPYPGFEWLPLLNPAAMRLVVWILGLASICLAAGVAHRVSATVVFLSWGYLYAVESTRTYWMSYYYLELLISFLIIWMPAHRRYSVPAVFANPKGKPAAPATVPFWSILLLRLQLVITYFYAGVAKLNADWLLDAQPVRRFLADAAAGTSGSLQNILTNVPFAYFLSWSGALFDLSVGFLLLARRTRLLGMVLLILFHATNHFFLFEDIVWFPLLGVLSATIFLNPDWPERFGQWLRQPRIPKPDFKWLVPGAFLIPIFGAALDWKSRPVSRTGASFPLSRLTVALMGAWIGVQVLLPLRHLIIPGDSRITFEGLSFSWRLKAEVYGAEPAQLTVNDPNILSHAPGKPATIQWDRWPEEKVFYRFLKRGRINWTNLPEIVVTFEPRLGERVFYNPAAPGAHRSSGAALPTDDQSRARIQALWRERFGRDPKSISRTFALHEMVEGYARSLQARGAKLPDTNSAQGVRDLVQGLLNDTSMSAVLRRTHPFSIERGSSSELPFLLIEDPALFKRSLNIQTQVDRTGWKYGPEQSSPLDSIHHVGRNP